MYALVFEKTNENNILLQLLPYCQCSDSWLYSKYIVLFITLQTMTHIFVSYSKFNRDYAQQLTDKLLREGFNVWIDAEKLRSSEDWWRAIVYALRTCDAFIVIMTSHSDQSQWVQRELTLAMKYNKPIYPLHLEGDKESVNWEVLVRTQIYDVTDGNIPQDAFFDDMFAAGVNRRRSVRGVNVTRAYLIENVPLSKEETLKLDDDIQNPPDEPEQPDTSVRPPTMPRSLEIRRLPRNMFFALPLLFVTLLVVAALVLLTEPWDSTRPPATATMPVLIDVSQIATLNTLNAWRASQGFSPLVQNDLLQRTAETHLSDLSRRTREEVNQTSPFINANGQELDRLPGQNGYNGRVVTFAVDEAGDTLTLGELLDGLERRGGSDVHQRITEVGLDTASFITNNRFIFVIIVGHE